MKKTMIWTAGILLAVLGLSALAVVFGFKSWDAKRLDSNYGKEYGKLIKRHRNASRLLKR